MKSANQRQAARHAGEDIDLDFSERTGFLIGKSAALADWAFRKEQREFAALAERLRHRKYAKEHPEIRRAQSLRWVRRHRVRLLAANKLRLLEKHRREAKVISCGGCGVEFCRVPGIGGGTPREFCRQACQKRAWRRQQFEKIEGFVK